MKKILLITYFFAFYIGMAQTLEYDIISKGHSIGYLTTTKTVKGNLIQIDVTSEVTARILIKIDVKYKLQSTYKNGKLLFSSITTYVNGKIHSTCKTEKTEDHYTITKDGHITKLFNIIDYSNALLYFEAPKNKSIVFSESNGIEKKIEQKGANEYSITSPKNHHVNQYNYSNGVLENATIHNTFITFTLTKQ